jgi:hypothetical protein
VPKLHVMIYNSTHSQSRLSMEINRRLQDPPSLPRGKEPRHPLDRRLGVLQSRSEWATKIKSSGPDNNRIFRPVVSHLTALSWLVVMVGAGSPWQLLLLAGNIAPWHHESIAAVSKLGGQVYWYKMAAASAESMVGEKVCYHTTSFCVLSLPKKH